MKGLSVKPGQLTIAHTWMMRRGLRVNSGFSAGLRTWAQDMQTPHPNGHLNRSKQCGNLDPKMLIIILGVPGERFLGRWGGASVILPWVYSKSSELGACAFSASTTALAHGQKGVHGKWSTNWSSHIWWVDGSGTDPREEARVGHKCRGAICMYSEGRKAK